ncbi:MAG: putative 29 kDa ribonucleoprotein B [Streblomastix strix]|uniref:Putative 29 kDa ribonucleoprotein B n=1 Tax=Streblomastix strix TaxID=222440 RepID=A0A5J4UCK7_9EUKA|nr:MAG: putative 29 kDa ribonucleoprotein B [Streblomastix strix]
MKIEEQNRTDQAQRQNNEISKELKEYQDQIEEFEQNISNRLHVGNLGFSTDAQQLGQLFQTIGKVQSVQIITQGRISQGYGFVTMEDKITTLKALSVLNNHELNGRNIHVSIANQHREQVVQSNRAIQHTQTFGGSFPRNNAFHNQKQPRKSTADLNTPLSKTRIHIKNLSNDVTQEELRHLFQNYIVTEVVIIKRPDGTPAGYGFVEFATEQHQNWAIKKYQNYELKGKKIFVSAAKERRR